MQNEVSKGMKPRILVLGASGSTDDFHLIRGLGLAADLPDDPGADTGVGHADLEVVDDLVRHVVHAEAIQALAVEVRLTVVAGAHDHVHTGGRGEAPERERIAAEALAGALHEG